MGQELVQIASAAHPRLSDRLSEGRTFFIETFGCQMNFHDSEKVAGLLIAKGYQPARRREDADLILLNTCSIREKAAQKVFSRLGILKQEVTENGKLVGVLGCVAQQEGEHIFARAPHVSLVCGSASYPQLPELIEQLERGDRRVTGLSLDTDDCFETEFTRRDNPYRAYLTIMEGCDKECAYCVVPGTRGRERSRPSESILAECRKLVDEGYTEIQLLGQNVNSYRDPSVAGRNFAELLAAVAEIPGLRRVRFTTSHPRDFNPEIVKVMDTHPTLCNHIHLPVQAGSNAVLARMLRGYSRQEYLAQVEGIRNAKRPMSISTDLIVGFCGETEADFEQTLSLLDEVQFDFAFSFAYSERPGTAAARLADDVPPEEKARRLAILQERQAQIQLARNRRFFGGEVEVLVDGYRARLQQATGRTSCNRVVNFPGKPEWQGRYLKVQVTSAGANSLVGVQKETQV